MKLAGKVVVVTGAAGGIGRELVGQLLERGAKVAAVDLSPERLDALADEVGDAQRLSTHVVNIADRDRVHALPDEVIAHHGVVDAVINNAGIVQPFVRVNDLDYDIIDRVLKVNLYGTLHMVKAFLPHLLERPEAHLANVSSMGGFMPFPGQTVYGVAKAGVKLLTEGLYAELMDTKVGVSVVCPGAVATDITANSGVTVAHETDPDEAPLKPLPAPDAARIVLDGIEAGRLLILVGKDARLMHLGSRVAPKVTTRFVARQMRSLLED